MFSLYWLTYRVKKVIIKILDMRISLLGSNTCQHHQERKHQPYS